jgi:hypothetical protein
MTLDSIFSYNVEATFEGGPTVYLESAALVGIADTVNGDDRSRLNDPDDLRCCVASFVITITIQYLLCPVDRNTKDFCYDLNDPCN